MVAHSSARDGVGRQTQTLETHGSRFAISWVARALAMVLAAASCASPAADDGDSVEADLTNSAGPEPLPDDYESMRAEAKQEFMWNKRVLPSKYETPPPWGGVDAKALLMLDLSVSMDRSKDELPTGRKKLLHERGSVVKVEYIADATAPYSGLWKGAVGIARLSLAASPEGGASFTPAIALKMFIDGKPSQNLQVMFSSDGQGQNFDFFGNTFTNILPQPQSTATKVAGLLFKKANPFPNAIGLDGFSKTDRAGVSVDRLRAPHKALFVPTPEVKAIKRASTSSVDFRTDLAKIPSGTVLYEVLADGFAQPEPVHIGKLVTRSAIIAARYGDEQLFFKHEGAKSGD
jgi:hypothetical protein